MEEEVLEVQEENASLAKGGAEQGEAEGLEINPPVCQSADSPLYKGALNEEKPDFREHLMSLERQGNALRQSLPGFDLRQELRDPMFARLTSPLVGLSVEDAYYALHRRELQQAAAKITAGSISRSIQAGQLRPKENSGARSGSVQSRDYSKATKQQREELKAAIRNASARGEKIYP